MKKLFLCLLALLLTSACVDQSAPKDVMDEASMTQFLTEAYLLEGYYAIECGYDFEQMEPQIAKSYDHLLSKYGLSRGDFEKSISYYLEHDDVYNRILDSVVSHLNDMEQNPSSVLPN